jgi:putative addiction module component (TIGR02574 family)
MDPRCRSVLDAALALSESDCAAIARELLATLAPDTEDPADDDLAAELDRRLDEALNDPEATTPWGAMRDER